jgi:hypothetical protein
MKKKKKKSWWQKFAAGKLLSFFGYNKANRLLVMIKTSLWALSTSRVTRLGEFSPEGGLFALTSYMKNTEVAHIFGPLFSTVKFMHKF